MKFEAIFFATVLIQCVYSDSFSSFQMIKGEFTFDQAKEACKKADGRLAVIKDDVAQNSVMEETRQSKHPGCLAYESQCRAFIGYKRERSEDPFQWQEGCSYSFTNFLPPDPDSCDDDNGDENNRDENCVEILGKAAHWNDVDCNKKLSAVCEFPPPPIFEIEVGNFTYDEAKEVCKQNGGRLAVIKKDDVETGLLFDILSSPIPGCITDENEISCRVWIAYKRNSKGDDFEWEGGCSTFNDFVAPEPINKNRNENCTEIMYGNTWKAVPCDERMSAMCDYA